MTEDSSMPQAPDNDLKATEKVLTKSAKKTAKKNSKPKKRAASKAAAKKTEQTKANSKNTAFPLHSIAKALRVPKAILEQNAGRECSVKDAAKYAGVSFNGELGVEISSAGKYGLLERPASGTVKPTDFVRRLVRPQSASDRLEALRSIVLAAPVIGDVYKNYRGENLPDRQFFENTLVDTFKVPADRLDTFISVFRDDLIEAELLEKIGDKERVVDVTHTAATDGEEVDARLKRLSKGANVSSSDICFVMQPFEAPLGLYYENVYAPAIRKAGLTPVRADADIFGTGKIIDQIRQGIRSSKVLVAELTKRNPNVFYELGLAHAMQKPVVLISSNEEDVPFDVRHVRVLYYDVNDPFWGTKLIDKVAEMIVAAIKNPKEAILFDD